MYNNPTTVAMRRRKGPFRSCGRNYLENPMEGLGRLRDRPSLERGLSGDWCHYGHRTHQGLTPQKATRETLNRVV